MTADSHNGQDKGRGWIRQTRWCFFKVASRWLVLSALFISVTRGFPANTPMTEYQVKALCVLNFAKYTDWPAGALPETNAPITIGIIGESWFKNNLQTVTSGKTLAGRAIVIREIHADEDCGNCQILFISASETKNLADILGRVKGKPILTVGETEAFLHQGGIINFVVRSGKVRFDISVDTARPTGLKLSSKLLSLADNVCDNP
jgi:hypothetical protein